MIEKATLADTPKKRAVRKTATKKTVPKKVTKRVASKKEAATKSEDAASVVKKITTRKAPTTITEQGPARGLPLSVKLSAAAFALALGGSAALGFSSEGMIDVAQVIQARESQNSASDEAPAPVVKPQVDPTVPNGGLRGSGKSNTPPPTAPVETLATTTQLQSDEATTTEAIAENTEETVVPETTEVSPEPTLEAPVTEQPATEDTTEVTAEETVV